MILGQNEPKRAQFSLDMVTVVQSVATDSAPEFGATKRISFDFPRHPLSVQRKAPLAAGVERHSVFGQQLRFPGGGTFHFWCDGKLQACRFNPAHLGRSHSLASFQDFSLLLEMANECVRLVGDGRPLFREGDRIVRPNDRSDGVSVSYTGARLSRVDVARLYAAGSADDARRVVLHLAQEKRGTALPSGFRGQSVLWHERSRLAKCRVYLKGPELRETHPDCPSSVLEWCDKHGIIRHEVETLSRFLRQKVLDMPSCWSAEAAEQVLDEFDYLKGCETVVERIREVYQVALAKGFTPRRARKLQLYALSWSQGLLEQTVSPSTFYRVRAELLKVGIDVFGVFDAEASKAAGRVLSVRPVEFPARTEEA